MADGYVYIGGNDHNLYQLNASNVSLAPIATFTTGGAIQDGIATANGYVYFGSADHYFYQLNATNISLENVVPPTQGNPILNSTFGTNLTSENLTVYNQSSVGATTNTINWYLNDTNLQVLNMPFEGGSNSIWTRDYSDQADNGTVTNAIWNATGGFDGNGAYEFDGTNSIIDLSNDLTSNNLTITSWIKPGTITAPTGYDIIIRAGDGSDTFTLFNYELGVWRSGIFYGSGIVLSNDTWHFVSVAYNDGAVNYSVDGSFVSSTAGSGNFLLNAPSIGADHSGFQFFNGTIDNVQIFNRSLSNEEVRAIYNNHTNLMVSQELQVGDVWKACITPNDGTQDGETKCSNTVTVLSNSDTTPPQVQVLSPRNITYINNSIDLNFTATDDVAIDSCWYSNDSGVTNHSLTSCNNITLHDLPEGGQNVIVYANDTSGNENSFNVIFTVDTIAPTVSSVILNSTLGTNTTSENLTVHIDASDSRGRPVYNITNWFVNGSSLMVLNMPFEG